MKKLNFFQTNKSTQFVLMLFICTTLIMSVIIGCDDKDSSEAKLFDAQQALDKEQWLKARAILESLSDSEIKLQYLSNTYSGEVGINTFDLLNTIEELDDTDNAGSIDMIGKLIGNDDDIITHEEVTTKLEKINEAIDKFSEIAALTGGLNSDQTVQLGIASVTRTSLIIASMICEQTSSDSDEIELTEEWIQANKGDFHPFVEADSPNWGTEYSPDLIDDMENISNAVTELSDDNDIQDDDNDIQDDLDEFNAKIDNGEGGGTGNDGIIAIGELNHYIDIETM